MLLSLLLEGLEWCQIPASRRIEHVHRPSLFELNLGL